MVSARGVRLLVLVGALAAAACAPGGVSPAGPAEVMTPAAREVVQRDVRAFMAEVASTVSAQGPAGWRQAFADGPEFFMASDGQLVFADGASADRGIEALTHTLPKITLSFGADLRVDVLTPAFAVIGASYEELQGDARGAEHTVRGYFTAVAERHQGRWQLRDAHWSSRP